MLKQNRESYNELIAKFHGVGNPLLSALPT